MLNSFKIFGYTQLEEIKYTSIRVCKAFNPQKQKVFLKFFPDVDEEKLLQVIQLQEAIELHNKHLFAQIKIAKFDNQCGIEICKYNSLQFPLEQYILKRIIQSLAKIFQIFERQNWIYFYPDLNNILIDDVKQIKLSYFSTSSVIYQREKIIKNCPTNLGERYSVYLGLIWYNLKNGQREYRSIQDLIEQVENSQVDDKQQILNLIKLKENYQKYIEPTIPLNQSLLQRNLKPIQLINQQTHGETYQERVHSQTEPSFKLRTFRIISEEEYNPEPLSQNQQVFQQSNLQVKIQEYICDEGLVSELVNVCTDEDLSEESKKEKMLQLCMAKIAL